MAGYIGTQAVSVNTTSATISDDLAVGDDLTVTDDAAIGGDLAVTGATTFTGKVGLGTAAPQGTFVVQASDAKSGVDNAGSKHLEMGIGSGGCSFMMTTGHTMAFGHQPYSNRGTDTNFTNRMTVESAGNVTIEDGDLVFGTAGHGICLGATSATAANTLHDYEEGSWTPIFAASGYTFQYNSTTAGKYVKVGKLVHLNGYIRLSHAPSGSGAATLVISQLPFTISNTDNSSYSAGALVVEGSSSFFSGTPSARPNKGSTNIGIFNVRAGASPTFSVTPANLTSGMEFEFQVTYHV